MNGFGSQTSGIWDVHTGCGGTIYKDTKKWFPNFYRAIISTNINYLLHYGYNITLFFLQSVLPKYQNHES